MIGFIIPKINLKKYFITLYKNIFKVITKKFWRICCGCDNFFYKKSKKQNFRSQDFVLDRVLEFTTHLCQKFDTVAE